MNMLRRLLVATAVLLCVGPAIAVDATTTAPTVSLTPEDTTNWQSIPTAFDQCVAGLQLRGDPSVCRGLSQYLNIFAQRVGIAARAAATPGPATANMPLTPPPAAK